MKRLIVCADGTWSTPGQTNITNVVKVRDSVAAIGDDGAVQKVFYDRGVGTDGTIFHRLAGGATGAGLNKNIQDCYRFLMYNYEPGDELFFFGFSRGAYTVRSLAGFIRNSGILKLEHAACFDEAFQIYRSRTHDPHSDRACEFREKYSLEGDREIAFIGVWDTVGSLGVPAWGPTKWLGLNKQHEFHDVELSGCVKRGYQALAIDEQRGSFKPSIWRRFDEEGNQILELKEGQMIEQAWFAGYHGDVGGGTSYSGLSDVTFVWMVAKAEAAGLCFDGSYVAKYFYPHAEAPAHDSRAGIWGRVPLTHERPIGTTWPQVETVHSAVLERREKMSPPYKRANLERYLARK